VLCFFPIQGIAGWKGTPATFVMRVQLDLVKYFDKELEKKAQRKGITTLYLNTNLVSNTVVHCVFPKPARGVCYLQKYFSVASNAPATVFADNNLNSAHAHRDW